MRNSNYSDWFSNEMSTNEALKEWDEKERESVDLENERSIDYYNNRQNKLFKALYYTYYCHYKEEMDLTEWLSQHYWADDLSYTDEFFIIDEINEINNKINISNYEDINKG